MITSQNDQIGERIRFYRTSREVSMANLAEALPRQITGQQLAKYETGQSRWPADLVMEIAGVLAVDIRLLLGIDIQPETISGDQWEVERCKHFLLAMKKKQRDIAIKIIHILSHN